MEHNKRKIGFLEILALLVYAFAHLGMALVHEPWFDEAQAWQIARSASLSTVLFETPHYEGHPPLWHLILMPFAKSGGVPYEFSLTLVSLLFMGTAVYLLLRYAPFPRPIRLLLPFTYFWFYQYGVISRVYCLMTLEFVLLAIFYKERNKKPGRYTATLMLLCATSAYGIVIAGGLAVLWLWEILKESGPLLSALKSLRGYAKDWRIRWLAVLLLLAVCVILQIMPREGAYAAAAVEADDIQSPFGVRLLYTLLILPADVTVTDIYNDYTNLYRAWMPLSNILSGCVLGIMIWMLLLYYGRKKRTVCLCVLPYFLFALFSAKVYMWTHHIGIGLLYFCFWSWVSVGQDGDMLSKAKPRTEAEKGVRILTVLMGTLAMGFSLYWTVAACVQDIGKNYWPGRNTAKFMKEHHLEQYRIMAEWKIARDSDGNIIKQYVNHSGDAISIAPYFEYNLFFNLNEGRDERNYDTHILLSEEEVKSCLDRWRKDGPPEVLLGSPDLEVVYGDAVSEKDYALVYREGVDRIWKAGSGTGNHFEVDIYVKKDLLKETGLQEMSK